MGKISNYKKDESISLNDKLIGSDFEDNWKTKSFTILSFINYLNDSGSIDFSKYLPYIDAIMDVDTGQYSIKSDSISLNQSPVSEPSVAKMRWNNVDGTIEFGLKGGNVNLQIGQESVIRIVNKTNENLLESQYKVVRVRNVSEGGAQGQRLAVALAKADNDFDSATTIGLVTENINKNQEGYITTSGEVRGINTTGILQGETWYDGDLLYLSSSVLGKLTKIKPIAPQHTIIIGYVVYSHAINGKIFVKVDNGYELDELHNVKITNPINGQVLMYNSSNSLWENKTI